MSRTLRLLPLALIVLLIGAFVWCIAHPPETTIPSQLIGKSVPQFELPPALPGSGGLSTAALATGEPRLLNIFASWCVPCIAEAPILEDLRRQGIAIDGIAVRDRPEELAMFLRRNGNPFQRIGADYNSSVQLALGSTGVPESFVVDGRGVIRYQHIGPIEQSHVARIRSEVEKAR